jgi:hypothetical protein
VFGSSGVGEGTFCMTKNTELKWERMIAGENGSGPSLNTSNTTSFPKWRFFST